MALQCLVALVRVLCTSTPIASSHRETSNLQSSVCTCMYWIFSAWFHAGFCPGAEKGVHASVGALYFNEILDICFQDKEHFALATPPLATPHVRHCSVVVAQEPSIYCALKWLWKFNRLLFLQLRISFPQLCKENCVRVQMYKCK